MRGRLWIVYCSDYLSANLGSTLRGQCSQGNFALTPACGCYRQAVIQYNLTPERELECGATSREPRKSGMPDAVGTRSDIAICDGHVVIGGRRRRFVTLCFSIVSSIWRCPRLELSSCEDWLIRLGLTRSYLSSYSVHFFLERVCSCHQLVSCNIRELS
jgi:hypothetical protein